jgi:hypothetical protein
LALVVLEGLLRRAAQDLMEVIPYLAPLRQMVAVVAVALTLEQVVMEHLAVVADAFRPEG